MWTPVAREMRASPSGFRLSPDARRLDDRPAAVTLIQIDLRDGRIDIVQSKVIEIGDVVVAQVAEDVHPHRRVEQLPLERVVRLCGNIRQVGENVLVGVRHPKRFRLNRPEHCLDVSGSWFGCQIFRKQLSIRLNI